jgi:hypothetical protein
MVESAIQSVTITLLGLGVPKSPTDPLYSQVRIGWQPEGQPFDDKTADVVYIRAIEDDDEYNQLRDLANDVLDVETIQQHFVYTRVWKIFWCFYGPNSFDRARQLHSGLLTQAGHDLMAGTYLYQITDESCPRRIPELIQKQWFERVDFEVRFNELVNETPPVPAISSVEIIVETASKIVADIDITIP